MKIEIWPLSNVKPYDRNSKKHPKEQVAKIAESIKQFGWDQPIVVDEHGVIIKGHGRRAAAESLKLTQVPVLVRKDLTPDQVKAARLADNRVAISDIDSELFRQELEAMNVDLLKGIFDDKELEFSVADLGSMNIDAFISDVDGAVREQDEKTREMIEDISGKRIPISKVIGFKDVAGANEIHIVRFMAHIEALTGKSGEEAFVQFAQSQTDV